MLIGTVSLAIGLLGLVLPIIPTTPFILLSAWCYYRGSQRFHDWLINHPYLGKIVEEYSYEEGMKKESKTKAIVFTWAAILLTAIFLIKSTTMRSIIILIGCFGTLIILRLKTREE